MKSFHLSFIKQPGFEVCSTSGKWYHVLAPKKASDNNDNVQSWFLVQAGDCLRRWTNHRYTSALHRVVPQPLQGDRYAMPYFWGPSEAYVMTSLTEGDKESRYPPMTFAEYEEAYAKAQGWTRT